MPTCLFCEAVPAVEGSRFCWACMAQLLTTPAPAPARPAAPRLRYPTRRAAAPVYLPTAAAHALPRVHLFDGGQVRIYERGREVGR